MTKLWPEALLRWYEQNKRDLPWRHTRDPYAIWVSEVMLQQTRVETVIPYYERFLTLFPTLEALAEAPLEQVYKAWEGLGYYSRARNLQKGAAQIVERYGGVMPRDRDELRKISGIGEYSAGSVASIAFGLPVSAVDGNVMRVGARLYEDRQDIAKESTKKYWRGEAEKWIPEGRASDFNQSLMELGALICLPKNPRCDECPIKDWCKAHQAGCAEELPVKSAKPKPVKESYRVFALADEEGRVLMEKRPEGGLLAGLWLLPMDEKADAESFCASRGLTVLSVQPLCRAKHVFTHRVWEMEGVLVRVSGKDAGKTGAWLDFEGRRRVPVASAQVKILQKMEECLL